MQQLTLLHERFPQCLLIPQAAWREVVAQGGGRPGAQAVAHAAWISVRSVPVQGILQLLLTELEDGEAETIALAYEIGAQVVLLDERDARQAAKRLGLRALGTIGMLMWATRRGRLPSLRMMLDALQTQGRFRISRALYEQALREVGEQAE